MKIRTKIILFLLRKVFHYVTIDDVLIIKRGKFYVGDKMIPQAEARQLKSEARDIQGMLLWNLINNNILYSVNKEMYERYTRHDDMVAGKSMIHTVESYKELARKIASVDLDYGEPKKEIKDEKKEEKAT